MAPAYNAPVNLSLTVVEQLNQMSDNGNLAALAAGPVSVPASTGINNATGPFHFTFPPNSYNFSAAMTIDNGGQPNDGWYIDYIVGNPLSGIPLIPLQNPSGVCLPTATPGNGNIPGVYDNGAAGVGATFTIDPGSLPFTYDSGEPVLDGDTVFFFGQDDATQNGLYIYTLATGVLTRQSGFDVDGAFVTGQYCYVINAKPGIPGTLYITVSGTWSPGVTETTFIQGTTAGSILPVTQDTTDVGDFSVPVNISPTPTDYFMILGSESANVQPSMNGATATYVAYVVSTVPPS